MQQVQYNAGVEGARPRSHRQAIEAAEPKRALDTFAVAQRAETGAAA